MRRSDTTRMAKVLATWLEKRCGAGVGRGTGVSERPLREAHRGLVCEAGRGRALGSGEEGSSQLRAPHLPRVEERIALKHALLLHAGAELAEVLHEALLLCINAGPDEAVAQHEPRALAVEGREDVGRVLREWGPTTVYKTGTDERKSGGFTHGPDLTWPP